MSGKLRPPSESGRIGAESPVSAAAGAAATNAHMIAAHAAARIRFIPVN
jgi:hypothetical protein